MSLSRAFKENREFCKGLHFIKCMFSELSANSNLTVYTKFQTLFFPSTPQYWCIYEQTHSLMKFECFSRNISLLKAKRARFKNIHSVFRTYGDGGFCLSKHDCNKHRNMLP